MHRFMKRRPSPAFVISVIALFVVLGGSAYALSKGAVKTKNLKNGAVTTKKLKNKAVTAAKLADGAITPTKIDGVIPSGFALVFSNGNLFSSAGNVIGVNRAATGVFCFNLSSKVNGAVVSLESSDSGLGDLASSSTSANAPCVAPFTDYRVDTNGPGGHVNDGFNIAFF
jgi:hypothetical protein